uniref:Multi-domain non-ribosomal peptide synthetase n=1 Tax=Pseudenhygromyxa salsuginis TaxID=442868 RepID=A0A3Q8I368_9BACT|nr:multi-domain non-ribosomal peptide synthetase [Pseudenhygromyxa salsuginis]
MTQVPKFAAAEHPSLNHRLVERLPASAERSHFRFVGDDGETLVERSLGEVVERARFIAEHLVGSQGLVPGERAVLIYLPGLEFIEAFLGCLLCGVVPAPIVAPDPLGGDIEHLRHVVADAGAKVLLTQRSYQRARQFARLGRAARLRAKIDWPDLPWVVSDGLRGLGRAQSTRHHLPDPSDLAFLQYTSGSTGRPRGVRVTHANLAHNLTYNTVTCSLRGSLVYWVPHYHDFGLICGILANLWNCGDLTLMSPLSFLRRPALWPEMMHRHRATISTAPNFALELTLRKTTPEQRASWDLSCVELIGLGGEPVRPETVDRFERAFAVAGLRPRTLGNCYGLAEHVVGVMAPGFDRIRVDPEALRGGVLRPSMAPDAREFIDGGPANDFVRWLVVDPDTREPVPEGHLGELWVSSPSVTDGYQGLPSPEIFAATTEPDDGFRYLRTGDQCAMIDGRVYVTGRLKELIIVRGHNLLPTDLENALRDADPSIVPGRVAAFGADDHAGSQQVVLFVEIRDETPSSALPSIAERVRTAVINQVPGSSVGAVVLGRRGLISKTSSGKIMRQAARERFASPDFADHQQVRLVRRFLPEIERPEPSTSLVMHRRARVIDALARTLGRPIDAAILQRSPRELGMDSGQVVELQALLEEDLGESLAPDLILAAPSLEQLLSRMGAEIDVESPVAFVQRWRPLTNEEPDHSQRWVVLPFVGEDGASQPLATDEASTLTTLAELGTLTEPCRVLLDLRAAGSDPRPAIEACRTLAQALVRNRLGHEVTILTCGAVTCDDGEIPRPAMAAVWGFCRALRSAYPDQRWLARDLTEPTSLAKLVALCPDDQAELCLRHGVAFCPVRAMKRLPRSSESRLAFAGSALLVGRDDERSEQAAYWLVRDRGVTHIVFYDVSASSSPPAFLTELREAGTSVTHMVGAVADTARLDSALDAARASELEWVVFIPDHVGSGPAERQTRGRIDAALDPGWLSLQRLAAACEHDEAHLLVLTDLSGVVAPGDRASWVASCLAMEATVTALKRRGRRVTLIGHAPRIDQVTARERSQLWQPHGIEPLPVSDELPLVTTLISAGITHAMVWMST